MICFAVRAADSAPTPQQLEFFEKKIRPLLTENCYKCHSHDSEKIKGGLLLDTHDGVLKGGDTGPALVPGNPDKSLIIEAVRYTNKDLQMPPNDRQLENSQIADLETWVKMGAPDPRTANDAGAHNYAAEAERAKKHWAFQSITHPAVPQPDDSQHWVQTPVDNFILAKLLDQKLTPSPRADKITLLRRATFDLIGLPPTPKEVDDFLADNSPDAFEKVVDRLLASPHYGERWGRYWLDLAHFSDTKGNIGNGQDERYPYAYIYRDYVIRAFNEDLPYNQFLMQQIAADRLPLGDDKRPLAALGFLTLGNRAQAMNDMIDERIDIISKGTMALTVTCARCHDHKFDPIPTKDYYALHGVFNSCIEPKEEPLIETPKDTIAYREFKNEYAKREAAVKTFRAEVNAKLKGEIIGKCATYMLAVHEFHQATNGISRNAFMEKRGLFPQLANGWDDAFKNLSRKHNPVFAPWFAFEQLSDAEFSANAKTLAATFYANEDKKKPINPMIARMFGNTPASLAQVAARYASVFAEVDQHWEEMMFSYEAKSKSATNAIAAPKALSDPGQEQIRQQLMANQYALLSNERYFGNFLNRDQKTKNKLQGLERDMVELVVTHPGSPARAPVLEDADKPHDSYVMIKGNPGNRGPVVSRHFLSILSGNTPLTFKDGSGRLDLARDIASKDNPLTARVIVNRVWLHHFGEGIVRTPDDFGTRGMPPSHPELLDYLASRFMDDGWSIKKLHRVIMLSSAYQQSSDENPRFEQIDPENKWLWRMNRRRLDFEALRDTVLAIGGDLDLSVGGRPVKLDAEPYPLRRTVYGFVDRRNMPNMFQAFDFASPDLVTGKRENTVVPQQALFMMNSPLVVEQARNVVRRVDFKAQANIEARIDLLYKLIYQRTPTDMEMKLAKEYLMSDSATEWQTTPQSAWEYGFSDYVPSLRRLKQFIPMGAFANRAWTPGGKNLDNALRGLSLTPDGGNPGKLYAVVRRWTSPRDGFISIEGTLSHPSKDGDGVQGHIISSRSGELGNWIAYGSQAETKLAHVHVSRGETIDFVTDCRENARGDNFKWAPNIKMEPIPNLPAEAVTEWRAQRDFSGEMRARRLTAWEKFAQVLLETNELTFVN
ncbi:MAG TPA: PSD1 and planctomycete cytochrome C domain-containing protein [Verrucomicrobiae bacterium]|nr:PSD1 and planctomycete cytochrome C domain-containing protein [Verrucomicrobiae bacterium]